MKSSLSHSTAKINPPVMPRGLVMRSAIWDLVRSSPLARVILVRAPAGYGKTTTMVQLQKRMKELGTATSWLTLTVEGNNPAVFLAELSAAAERVANIADVRSAHSPDGKVRHVSKFSLDKLALLTSPFALFLDDFHYINDPAVQQLLVPILERLPPSGRIILGTRVQQKIDLGRLRRHGQVLELDASQLRFSLDETAVFLKHSRNLHLMEEEVFRLQDKTEGWISGITIASLALNRRESRAKVIEHFSGIHPDIADYYAREVFSNQPKSIREFLLLTGILRHFTPGLCNKLTGRHDSAEILHHLNADGLFVASIESEDELTYRYHGLFADFLRGLLARERPEDMMRLHRIASAWYESNGQPVPAIDHALKAKSYKDALRLLAGNAETLLEQGRLGLLHRWFLAIPEEMLAHDPILQLIYAWGVCFMDGPVEATALLNRLGPEDQDNPVVHAHLLAFRFWLTQDSDDVEELRKMIEIGREASRLVPRGSMFTHDMLVNSVISGLEALGRHEEAQLFLGTVQTPHAATPFGKMMFECREGQLDLQNGRLRRATARFQMAAGGGRAPMHVKSNAYPNILYASVLYEYNECTMAESLLRNYLPSAEAARLTDPIIIAYVTLSRIATSRGDNLEALRFLDELEQFGHRNELPRQVATARLERSRLLLMQGRFIQAKEELDRASNTEMNRSIRATRRLGNDTEYFELCHLRWQVMVGNAEKALPDLEEEISEAVASSRHRRAITLRLLRALALDRSGDRSSALVLMGNVLRNAAIEGFHRLIVDEGPSIGTLVYHFEKSYLQHGSVHDPIFTVYLQRLVSLFSVTSSRLVSVDAAHEDFPVGELTAKEIRILQLLAQGCSNKELAEKLFVSDSTVRTHLRNINTKLKANNRTEAVAIGRLHRIIV